MTAERWALQIDANRPIAMRPDGVTILFDELAAMEPGAAECLKARGLVYVTEFTEGARKFAGHIIAVSWGQAEQIAQTRALGEEVTGLFRADPGTRPG